MIFDKLKAKLSKKPSPDLTKNIIDCGFTFRTYHCLRRAGIETVGDLVKLSWNDLAGMRNVVRRTIVEVEKVLGEMGLGLRKEI